MTLAEELEQGKRSSSNFFVQQESGLNIESLKGRMVILYTELNRGRIIESFEQGATCWESERSRSSSFWNRGAPAFGADQASSGLSISHASKRISVSWQ